MRKRPVSDWAFFFNLRLEISQIARIISTLTRRVLAAPSFKLNASTRWVGAVYPVSNPRRFHMKLRPLADRVIVKRVESETKTASGIFIPDNAAEKPI